MRSYARFIFASFLLTLLAAALCACGLGTGAPLFKTAVSKTEIGRFNEYVLGTPAAQLPTAGLTPSSERTTRGTYTQWKGPYQLHGGGLSYAATLVLTCRQGRLSDIEVSLNGLSAIERANLFRQSRAWLRSEYDHKFFDSEVSLEFRKDIGDNLSLRDFSRHDLMISNIDNLHISVESVEY